MVVVVVVMEGLVWMEVVVYSDDGRVGVDGISEVGGGDGDGRVSVDGGGGNIVMMEGLVWRAPVVRASVWMGVYHQTQMVLEVAWLGLVMG